MEYKQYDNKYVVRIDREEEIVASLKRLVRKEDIKLGSVQGIGAADEIELIIALKRL